MQEKLSALVNLQKVDLEIASLRKAAETYPKQLAELEKELNAAKAAVEAERSRLLDVERQKRTLEQNIADEKDKVRKWEARLAEQRTTREYAALAREIDIAKKTNQTMVEDLDELGKTLGAAREAVKAKEQEWAARQDSIGGRMAELKKQMSSAHSDVKTLEEKRSKLAGSVDKQLLHRYDVVKRRRMPALVPVLAPGTCQGCNMNVPPQLYNTLRSTLGTDICPSCHRIIYAAEALDPPAK
ncbi:MAG TPA: C4-type zinc ribbon domain-containing protein [Myxococcaceae bacterium]|nr:C4-type zinc ribbon domain-containing protein [Myxococcaceae bacterium]